jgi:hypothetical protein
MKKFLLSLIIIFVIGGDIMALAAERVLLSPQSLLSFSETDSTSTFALQMPGLSRTLDFSLPKLLFYFFYAGGVFNAVATFNLDYAFYGLPRGTKEGSPWVEISDVKKFFPYPLGETYLRLDMEWHKLLGEKTAEAAFDSLAAKIRERYNREHPNQPLSKVAIYMVWWPRSEKGYLDLRNPSNTHWLLVAVEK